MELALLFRRVALQSEQSTGAEFTRGYGRLLQTPPYFLLRRRDPSTARKRVFTKLTGSADKLLFEVKEMNRLHQLAEYADWYGWPPKRFWTWLLMKLDQRYGFLK